MEAPELTFSEAIFNFTEFLVRILLITSVIYFVVRRRFPKKERLAAAKSTHVLCTSCGLANPSVWEKCERCGVPLNQVSAPSPVTENEEMPPLVKKI